MCEVIFDSSVQSRIESQKAESSRATDETRFRRMGVS